MRGRRVAGLQGYRFASFVEFFVFMVFAVFLYIVVVELFLFILRFGCQYCPVKVATWSLVPNILARRGAVIIEIAGVLGSSRHGSPPGSYFGSTSTPDSAFLHYLCKSRVLLKLVGVSDLLAVGRHQ